MEKEKLKAIWWGESCYSAEMWKKYWMYVPGRARRVLHYVLG